MKMELRNSQTTLESDGSLTVRGYVNKTEKLSEVLGVTKKFREKIAKGAFKNAIENRSRDIDFLAEHDKRFVLASTRNGSLELREDEQGLFMSANITPTSYGRDYHTLITDGLIQNMSFGFRSIKDSWSHDNGMAIRTVVDLELYEVSAVKNPAYSQSTLSARNIDLIEDIIVPEQEQENAEERKLMKEMVIRSNELEQILRGETRALQTTTNGASLIPTEVQNEIVLKMEETSKVFAKARKIGSVAGTLRVNRENDTVVSGFVGEGNNVLEGAVAFEYVDLKQKRVGAAVSLSNQLINDSAVNIAEYAKNLLARRTAKAVEKSILTGVGGEEFAGIINDADINSVAVTGSVTMDNLLDLYLSINPELMTGASFIMQRDLFNTIAKMKDAGGHYYVQNGIVNGKLTYTLFGAEIDVTNALPAGTPVIFGNVEEAYSIMIKQEAGIQEIVDTTQALRGSKLFVFDIYCDGAVVNPQAIAKLTVA